MAHVIVRMPSHRCHKRSWESLCRHISCVSSCSARAVTGSFIYRCNPTHPRGPAIAAGSATQMKRRDERLDQRLGDFAPLHRAINEIHLERLLDRYGIALVCDYPQILFEHRDQMRLPGWWYRENAPGYLDIAYRRSSHAWYPPLPERTAPATGDYHFAHQRAMTRMREAQGVLKEVFYSSSTENGSRPARQRSYWSARTHRYG